MGGYDDYSLVPMVRVIDWVLGVSMLLSLLPIKRIPNRGGSCNPQASSVACHQENRLFLQEGPSIHGALLLIGCCEWWSLLCPISLHYSEVKPPLEA